MFPEYWTQHNSPVKPLPCCCVCMCVYNWEIWGRWSGKAGKNSKFEASQSETDETRLFPLSRSWKEDDWVWESWSKGTVTHSSAAGLLRHELDTVWVELCPQTQAPALAWKPGEAPRSAQHICTETALCCWWADRLLLILAQPDATSSKDVRYLKLSGGFCSAQLWKNKMSRHLYQQAHL